MYLRFVRSLIQSINYLYLGTSYYYLELTITK